MNDDHGKAIHRLRAGKPVTVGSVRLHKNDFPPRQNKKRKSHKIPPALVEALQIAVIRREFNPELYEKYRSDARTYNGSIEVESKLRVAFPSAAKQASSSTSSKQQPSAPTKPKRRVRLYAHHASKAIVDKACEAAKRLGYQPARTRLRTGGYCADVLVNPDDWPQLQAKGWSRDKPSIPRPPAKATAPNPVRRGSDSPFFTYRGSPSKAKKAASDAEKKGLTPKPINKKSNQEHGTLEYRVKAPKKLWGWLVSRGWRQEGTGLDPLPKQQKGPSSGGGRASKPASFQDPPGSRPDFGPPGPFRTLQGGLPGLGKNKR